MGFASVRNLLFGACVSVLVSYIAAALPDYVDKCAPGDQQCILKNFNTIFQTKYQGDEKFGLATLDPVKIGAINLKENSNSSVSIELTLANPIAYGAKYVRATKVKGFGKSPDGQHSMLVEAPQLTISSDYKISGRVLIVPLVGEGNSNFTFVNAQLKFTIHGTERNADGAIYLDVKDVDVDIIPQQFIMNLGNLSSNGIPLGDDFNEALNLNWRMIYEDLKPGIMNALKKPFLEGAASVFKKVPYSELFAI